MHLILVDEADQMSAAAQLFLLSKLDSTAFPPNTIFIFTCNSTAGLEARFLSRCGIVEFSNYGIAKDAAALLELVWQSEAGEEIAAPNFTRIVKEANNNIRAALMKLQNELMLAV
jgi:DNA polymerase III delta prime subunit